MTNTELLKDVISKSGLKVQRLAEVLGISRQALNKKIENKSQFKAGEIKALCDVLGIVSVSDKERIFFA